MKSARISAPVQPGQAQHEEGGQRKRGRDEAGREPGEGGQGEAEEKESAKRLLRRGKEQGGVVETGLRLDLTPPTPFPRKGKGERGVRSLPL